MVVFVPDHIQWHRFDRIPLNEGSARRRGLNLATHDTRYRLPCRWWDSKPHSQIAKPTHNYALDRATTGNGNTELTKLK